MELQLELQLQLQLKLKKIYCFFKVEVGVAVEVKKNFDTERLYKESFKIVSLYTLYIMKRTVKHIKKTKVFKQTKKNRKRLLGGKSMRRRGKKYTFRKENVYRRKGKKRLNIIKNKSGNYISFGGESRVVKHFFDFGKSATPLLEFDFEKNNIFDHFITMTKITPSKTDIKKDYGNGFVFRVQFQKEDIILNAILKSSTESESDNLYYEYLVGTNFVNNASTIFPCFVETYGYFLNTNSNLYNTMKNKPQPTISKAEINKYMTHIPDENVYDTICKRSKFLSLLVESVNGPTLVEYIINKIRKTSSQTPYKVVEEEFNMYDDNSNIYSDLKTNNNNMNRDGDSDTEIMGNKKKFGINYDKNMNVKKAAVSDDSESDSEMIGKNKFGINFGNTKNNMNMNVKKAAVSDDSESESESESDKEINGKGNGKWEGGSSSELDYFNNIDIVQYLYQIYCPLSRLNNEFTHYDLHSANVLMHHLDENGYILMQYIDSINNEIVEFKTSYVCKMIDYGSSFFVPNKLNSESPNLIYEKVSEHPKTNCITRGFEHLRDDTLSVSNEFKSSRVNNKSHDLKLLFDIKMNLNYQPDSPILGLFTGLNYNCFEPIENISNSSTINNVMDVELFLKTLINNDQFKARNNEYFKDKTMLGTLRINLDGSEMNLST